MTGTGVGLVTGAVVVVVGADTVIGATTIGFTPVGVALVGSVVFAAGAGAAILAGAVSSTYASGMGATVSTGAGLVSVGVVDVFAGYCAGVDEGIGDGAVVFVAVVAVLGDVLVEVGEGAVLVAGAVVAVLAAVGVEAAGVLLVVAGDAAVLPLAVALSPEALAPAVFPIPLAAFAPVFTGIGATLATFPPTAACVVNDVPFEPCPPEPPMKPSRKAEATPSPMSPNTMPTSQKF